MPKRTLYYWARLYAGQMEEGDRYRTLQKSITVNILDFDIMDNEQYHNVFHVHEDTTGQLLTMGELAKEEPAMQKALTTLEFLSQDDQARRLYEARQKALHDYASAIGEAMDKGTEKGRNEGLKEGRQEERLLLAKRLLEMGDSVEKVMEVTDLSREEIQHLLPH